MRLASKKRSGSNVRDDSHMCDRPKGAALIELLPNFCVGVVTNTPDPKFKFDALFNALTVWQ